MRTSRLKAIALTLTVLGTMLGACSSGGGDSRTIQVDHGHDEFAGTFRSFFPRDVTVKPGMTLKFHQTWSGEAHTVTMGTEIQDLIEPEMLPIIRKSTSEEPPDDDSLYTDAENAAGEEFFSKTPFFYGEKGPNPPAAQPCYLDTGLPPDNGKPCKQIDQPAFTGKQSYYSSGFIPYLGSRGNEYEMKIADDAKPGSYFYYCNLHGPGMSGEITVTKSGKIPSQADVNRQASKEVETIARPLLAQVQKERAGNGDIEGNLAGSGTEKNAAIKGQVNEFTPRTVKAKAGEPVTWTFIGAHSISFNVPPYVPLTTINKKGKVVENESVFEPAGGWPGRSTPTDTGDGPPGSGTGPTEHVTAPDFDGSGGLHSSGVDWETGDTYTVTFTKPGTYPMACLIHPGMIGKVVVS